MRQLPTGTVTFLFTDIEGSTRLLAELGSERYVEVLRDHRSALRRAFTPHGGVEIDTEGDAFFVAFARASDAVAAAEDAQRALSGGPVRVRMGLHTGEPLVHAGSYVGMDVHRAARIAGAGHGGQVLLSQTTRDLLGDAGGLRDLGEHRLKDLSASQRLYQLGAGDFPPIKSLTHTNLPIQATPLVGRDHELEEAGALVREHRLTTLVGPGGTGKTRLALQLAAEAADDFDHGVFFVSLAALRDPALVEPTVAQTVGAKDGLIDHLLGRQTLLLLDNFEHVIEAASGLAALLQAVPDVKLIVTSREALRLSGEHEYPVPPLAETDAIALFVERARAMKPGFAVHDEVAEICRRLDGLPLALELAAARVKVLTPTQILERLERRLDLLTAGVRDAPERQRTLRAAIEWSYELLVEDERRLFRALSIFAGAFTLEAVEEIGRGDLDTLASLADKSLLRQTDDGRFFVLETIREYGAERLEQQAETRALRRSHAEYYLALAERAAAEVRGPAQETWLERLAEQHANFSAAMKAFLDEGDVEAALRVGGALAPFWERRGRAGEGRVLLEPALRERAPVAPLVRAKALYGAGKLAYTQDDHGREREFQEEALELFRQAGDSSGEVLTEIELGWTSLVAGDLSTAKRTAERCVRRARELGDGWVHAYALRLSGGVFSELGDPDEAKRLSSKSLALFGACGDSRERSGALSVLGWLAIVDESYEEAGGMLEESIALASHADAEFLAINRSNLGLVNLFLGNDDQAVIEFSESLRFSVPLRAQRVAAESLLGMAAVAARASRSDDAALLRKAALAIHEACEAALNPVEVRIEERLLSGLRELETVDVRGGAMSLDEASDIALRVGESIRRGQD